MNLPKVRTDLLVQDLNDETLIYDLTSNKSYCLNSTAKIVFNACNGKTRFDDLKLQTNLPDDIIYLSLDELKKNDLFESDYVSPFAGMNRREVIRKVGLASMIALPVISALIAPNAASAASSCPIGQLPGNPTATQGRGDNCGCGTNVGAGNTCGAGTVFVASSTCRTGCVCRAVNCSNQTDTCVGACE